MKKPPRDRGGFFWEKAVCGTQQDEFIMHNSRVEIFSAFKRLFSVL